MSSSDVPQLSVCGVLPTKLLGRLLVQNPAVCFDMKFPITWQGDHFEGTFGQATIKLESATNSNLKLSWSRTDPPCNGGASFIGPPNNCDPFSMGAVAGTVSALCCPPSSTGVAVSVVTTVRSLGLPPQCDNPCPVRPCPPCIPSPATGSGANPGKGGSASHGSAPPRPSATSRKPVRYATGEIVVVGTDIESNGFGTPWGHTRSFASMQSVNETLGQGFCWKVNEWGYVVVLSDGGVVVQGGPNWSLWFTRLANGSYAPTFTNKETLVLDTVSNVYRLTDLFGTVTVYDASSGAFVSQTDVARNVIQVTAVAGNGFNPATVQRSCTVGGNTTIERFSYTYNSSSGDYLLSNVLLQRQVNGGAWQNVAQASYTYYPDGDSNGAYEDLKTVTTQLFSNGAWANTETSYYRYWKQLSASSSSSSSRSSSSSGAVGPLSVHLLKFVIEPAMYDQMVAAGFDPATASDAQLSLFADYYFEYDSQRRCTRETVQAGSQTYTFAYSQSSNSQDYNKWATKTVETLPDGNQNIVYSNYAGQTMLFVFQSGSDQWIDYYRYDSGANLVLHSNPSAVNGFDTTKADLVNWQSGTAQYLNKNSGLIETYTIHPPTNWMSGELVQQGQWGLPIILRQYQYVSCGGSSSSSKSSSSGSSASSAFTAPPIYFLSQLTEYPDDGSSGSSSSSSSLSSSSGPASGTANGNMRQIVTTWSYNFWPGTCAFQQITTTWPVVPSSQNGSGVAAQRFDYLDTFGNVIWSMDERGFITGTTYDIPTRAVAQRIDDVNTSLVSAPAGWATPSGGGLHLVTDFQFDVQGRSIQSLGPWHTIDIAGVATSIRRAAWTVYQDATTQTWAGQGYATAASSSSSSSGSSGSGSVNYNFALVNPVAITIAMKDGKVTDSIQAVRYAAGTSSSSSSSGSGNTSGAPLVTAGALTFRDSFPQSSYVRWSTTQYTDCCFVASQRVYKLIPATGTGVSGTNYDETDFGYDVMKRQNRVVTPGGTITRTTFEARGLPAGTWVGTDDTGATASNPAGTGAPNNMVQITGMTYDNGHAGGDGNLTTLIKYIDSSKVSDRVTRLLSDFRNRQTDTDGEIDFYAKQYFDNLDRVYRNERYNTTLSGHLIMLSTTAWDDRGVAFQAATYAVDPSTGTIGNALVDNTWRDASQNIVKSLPAGSQLFVKTTIDSLGRETIRYAGYGSDANYAAIFSVSNNTILEQAETVYDAADNSIESTKRLRYHNAPANQLGALANPSTTPNARVTYAALYLDALGRLVAAANYGTNGGTTLSRPSTIPARSDMCLVNSTTFNARGEAYLATDPAGTVTYRVFDDRGRRLSLVENYIATSSSSSSSSSSANTCAASDDANRTTNFSYTPDGAQATLTAVNVTTGNQTTTCQFGTTLTDSAVASSLLKRFEIYPDSVSGNDQIAITYNRQAEPTTVTDQNGSVHTFGYDKLGRRTGDGITTLGAGVDNAVLRITATFEVRGLLQNVTSYDNATVGAGSIVNDVQRTYNSFGQLAVEYQSHSGAVNVSTTPKVQYAYADGSANAVRLMNMTYPNGRVLNASYSTAGSMPDSLSRIASLIDDVGTTHLADYSYLGGNLPSPASGRGAGSEGVIVDVTEPQPHLDYTLIGTAGGNDPDTGDIYRGLDRFGRVKDLIWVPTGISSSSSSSGSSSTAGTNLVRIQHGYDRASNRLWRKDLVAEAVGIALDELYRYDGLYRLTYLQRGTLGSVTTAINSAKFAQCWTLDATGNWKGFRQDETGLGTWSLVQSRSANTVNEITGVTNNVGAAWVTPEYDSNGNMTTIPKPVAPASGLTAAYDAWNRQINIVEAPSGHTVQQNAFDGLRRRTVQTSYIGGVLSETRHYFYSSSWQILEERIGTSTTAERQSIWGLRYIDDLILRDRDTTGGGTLNERLCALQDPNWNVVAISDATGTVQERCAYDAYGMPAFKTPAYVTRSTSTFAWETLYCGYRYDAVASLYLIRNRILSPLTGTWLQRDRMPLPDDVTLYSYVGSKPVAFIDPSGLAESTTILEKKYGDAYVRIDIEPQSNPGMHCHVGANSKTAIKYQWLGRRFETIPEATFKKLIQNPATKAELAAAIRKGLASLRQLRGAPCICFVVVVTFSDAAFAGEQGGIDAAAGAVAEDINELVADFAISAGIGTAIDIGLAATGTTLTIGGNAALGAGIGGTAAGFVGTAATVGGLVVGAAVVGAAVGTAIANTQIGDNTVAGHTGNGMYNLCNWCFSW